MKRFVGGVGLNGDLFGRLLDLLGWIRETSSAAEARWIARFIASKRTAFWAFDC